MESDKFHGGNIIEQADSAAGRRMMESKKAIEILQKHIDTYKYQLTDGGWIQMVRMGIARPTIQEKLSFQKDAKEQIQAYEAAIASLEKLDMYEEIGLEPLDLFKAKNIAICHLKESLKENDRAIRKAGILGQDATEIRQASAEMERFLSLLSAGLDI